MASALFGPKDRPRLHAALLGLTLLTTAFTYDWLFRGSLAWPSLSERVEEAVLFSLSLVLILGSHEMGHYVLARRHGVDTSLPYFIPLPYVGFGTLGAVIRIRGRIPHRNALVDIGAAGPLMGLLVALPLLLWGMYHSDVVDVPVGEGTGLPGASSLWVLGRELWQELAAWRAGGDVEALASAASSAPAHVVFGDNLLMRFAKWVTHGPLPRGKDVLAYHPTVVAAWVGMLVTTLNLVPIGQLDGGHLAYALWGQRARGVGKLAAAGLLGLCLLASAGWVVWLGLASAVVGFRHPPVVAPEDPLSSGRRWVCAACLVALVLCLIPIPLREVAP
ncbi:MAG: site-2 protease family protein [Myxococcaceae bacterium]|nr:site-2 protease family protein [Myxococcaceae bacterium]